MEKVDKRLKVGDIRSFSELIVAPLVSLRDTSDTEAEVEFSTDVICGVIDNCETRGLILYYEGKLYKAVKYSATNLAEMDPVDKYKLGSDMRPHIALSLNYRNVTPEIAETLEQWKKAADEYVNYLGMDSDFQALVFYTGAYVTVEIVHTKIVVYEKHQKLSTLGKDILLSHNQFQNLATRFEFDIIKEGLTRIFCSNYKGWKISHINNDESTINIATCQYFIGKVLFVPTDNPKESLHKINWVKVDAKLSPTGNALIAVSRYLCEVPKDTSVRDAMLKAFEPLLINTVGEEEFLKIKKEVQDMVIRYDGVDYKTVVGLGPKLQRVELKEVKAIFYRVLGYDCLLVDIITYIGL